MESVEPRVRLPGVDLARFVALAGMVLVHTRSDLAPPSRTAAGGAGSADDVTSWLLELLQSAATDRARLLFLLLAGVGASLYSLRRGVRTSVLLRRAAFPLVTPGAGEHVRPGTVQPRRRTPVSGRTRPRR